MDLEVLLGKALCYVFMCQQTGKRGILRSDLESYGKILGRSGILDELAELKLIIEFDSQRTTIEKESKNLTPQQKWERMESAIRQRTFVPRNSALWSDSAEIRKKQFESEARYEFNTELDFVKTSITGETKAKELLIDNLKTSDLPTYLKIIPKRVLLFLLKNELFKLKGLAPVDIESSSFTYFGNPDDAENDYLTCLLKASNSRLSTRLRSERKKLYNSLISSDLCATASTYYETQEKAPKRTVVHTAIGKNYCVPPEVIELLKSLYKSELDEFALTKELLQNHKDYHFLIKLAHFPYDLWTDCEGSWGTTKYDPKSTNRIIDPFSDRTAIDALEYLQAQNSSVITRKKVRKWENMAKN
jgi:hypothetical protein